MLSLINEKIVFKKVLTNYFHGLQIVLAEPSLSKVNKNKENSEKT